MRIAIVTDTFRPDVNGVAMTLGRLVDGLRVRGHLVYVIHTGEKGGKGESVMKSVPVPGYPEVRVGLPGKGKLTKMWSKKRPEVVYVATESPLGLSAIKVARKLGIPVAAGFHTNFHHYLQGYRAGKMKNGALNYLRHLHNLADSTIVPTEDVRQALVEDGFTNIKVLGRGVDTRLFSPEKRCAKLRITWKARAGAPVVAIVGRVAQEKNLVFALEVVKKMQARMPDLQCVVVGDGPQRSVLKRQYRHAYFVGVRTGEDLARHYASADILLFPSETETFGNVVMEGMASGLVVVAYDYAGARQHITCGVNGLLAPKGDEDAYLEQAMKAMDTSQHEMLRTRARMTASELGWGEVSAQFETHLTNIMRTFGKKRCEGKKRVKLSVRTLFLSDIHLGTDDSKAREVIDVLRHMRCQRIVLNGDIIDGWALKRGKKWRSIHTRVIRVLLQKMDREKTEIIYLRGNHDDFMEKFMPITLGKLRCVKDFIHDSPNGKKYLVVHGDGFDSVSTGHRWLAVLGSVGYDALLRVNRVYNYYRKLLGKEHYSLSKAVKGKVKSAVSFISRYEEKLVELAKKRDCQGIICGHIHTPADEFKDGIHYLNSGDWVETMSCIIEEKNGDLSICYYEDIIERTLMHSGPDDDLTLRDITFTPSGPCVIGV